MAPGFRMVMSGKPDDWQRALLPGSKGLVLFERLDQRELDMFKLFVEKRKCIHGHDLIEINHSLVWMPSYSVPSPQQKPFEQQIQVLLR